MTRSDAQMLTHLAKAVCSRKIVGWPQQSRMTSGKIICQRESANVHAASQYPVEKSSFTQVIEITEARSSNAVGRRERVTQVH